jgi:tellurite resistance protein TehA-like permease
MTTTDAEENRGRPPGALLRIVGGLSPAYFAMVMATGIVSIAAKLQGMPVVAAGLFRLNAGFFAVLWFLYLARLALARDRFLADLCDHNKGVGYFTSVAATCVLGNQFVLIGDDARTGFLLWALGGALWLVQLYTIFTCLTIKREKPTLARGLNGGWLLPVVATQSVSVLGGLLAERSGGWNEEILFFSLATWLGGGMLYIWIIALIFYRYTFFTLEPEDLTPPYWINMGAMAISTLAGAVLVSASPHSALLREIAPFVKGFTLLFWATATFWIPMLLILGAWRHVAMRFPLRYDPAYWGAVFPLGMYTAATHRLADALDAPFLLAIPRVGVYVALAAWLTTFAGLARGLTRAVAGARADRS